jgi:hypothetical protein
MILQGIHFPAPVSVEARPIQLEEEVKTVEFILSHWHCLLPAAIIILAVIFMGDKPKNKNKKTAEK